MPFENPLGEARLANRQDPAHQPSDPGTLRHAIAALLSSVTTEILTMFAYCATATHPEFFWPLLGRLDGPASTEEPPSAGTPERTVTWNVREFRRKECVAASRSQDPGSAS
jgi:hypothetical protein